MHTVFCWSSQNFIFCILHNTTESSLTDMLKMSVTKPLSATGRNKCTTAAIKNNYGRPIT